MTLGALGAAALVGGWVALFERGERDEGEPVFGVRAEEILALTLERPGAPPVRIEREAEGFTVGADPADFAEADLLLQNAASLRFEREIAGTDLTAFGLDPPGLVVRIETTAGSRAAGFGDETLTPGNRYLHADGRVLVVPAFARDNLDRTAWDLRDKQVFRFENPVARRLRLEATGEAVELERTEGRWRILRPFSFAADPYAASQLTSRLLDAEMLGLAQGFDGEGPVATLDLEEEGSRTLRFGEPSRDPVGVLARIEGDPLVFVLDSALRDELEQAARSGLEAVRSLRLFRFAAFRAESLVIEGPGGELAFDREGEEWAPGVADLLYELNSIEAEGVGGEALPAGETWTVTVREEDGAPVTVRVAGGAWALREGDQRVLRLAPGAWDPVAAFVSARR